MLKFDLHLHTIDDPVDRHVRHTAFELIDKASQLGLNVLAITLHGAQLDDPEVFSHAEKSGILLIPGIEQDIEGRHVLLLNFERRLAEAIRTFADLERAKRPGHLVIAAHPYYPNTICLKEKLVRHARLFDAVELSGFHHRLWNPNRKAVRTARRLGIPLVGHSDTHTLEQLGTTFSQIDCPKDVDSLIAAIKAGRARVVSRPLSLREMAVIGWKVIVRGYLPWIDYRRRRGLKPRWP